MAVLPAIIYKSKSGFPPWGVITTKSGFPPCDTTKNKNKSYISMG